MLQFPCLLHPQREQAIQLQDNNCVSYLQMMERKKVVVVGANGNLARQLIPLLIKHFQVYCLTRSPSSFAINSIFLRFIEGDALSPESWEECLEGKDAVVSCFGAREGESESNQLEFVKLVSQKMAEKGVKRFIGFFSYGALRQNGHHLYEGEGFGNKERGAAHAQSIKVLENSQLDYTAVCLWKFQIGAGEVEAVQNSWSQTAANSQAVAAFLQAELQHPHLLRKTVFLSNKH